ncbi:MAG TPA: flagellar hook-length control protein FliK [Vicinamibacterales bacterium]|nr:flagellar hook-length control protein FliK [Vicinamibacterales bacterium]
MSLPLDPTAAAPPFAAAASDDIASVLPSNQSLSSAFNALLDLLASIDPDVDVLAGKPPAVGSNGQASSPTASTQAVTTPIGSAPKAAGSRAAPGLNDRSDTSSVQTAPKDQPTDDAMAFALSWLNPSLLQMPRPVDAGPHDASIQHARQDDLHAAADRQAIPVQPPPLPKSAVPPSPAVADVESDLTVPAAATPPEPAHQQLPLPAAPQLVPPQSVGRAPSVDAQVKTALKDAAKNVAAIAQQAMAAAPAEAQPPTTTGRILAFRSDVSRDPSPKRVVQAAVDSAAPVRSVGPELTLNADNESAPGTSSPEKTAQDMAAALTARTPTATQTFAHALDVRAVAFGGAESSVATLASEPVADAASLAAEDLSPQIVQAVRLQWSNGAGDVRITLQPEYLGELTVSLHVDHGSVSAVLHAESPDVRSWLQANQSMLGQALSEHGLTLERLVVAAPEGDRPATTADQRRQRQEQRRRQPQRSDPRSFEIVL